MNQIHVSGGKTLCGQVSVQGSKNAVLPMMAAAFLAEGISVLENCPRISDVFCMEEIMQALGAVTWWERSTLYLDCRHMEYSSQKLLQAGNMRSSIILLGVMAARLGEGTMGYPGGCVIGKRPIDLHLMALRQMGVRVEETPEQIRVFGKPSGAHSICFPGKSVGATEQAMLAAALHEDETFLENCAMEPEIVHLASCLMSMGVWIRGAGTGYMQIRGKKQLHACHLRVPPDRIVAGTYLLAGAATRGQVTLLEAPVKELGAFLQLYWKMGGQFQYNSGKLRTDSRKIAYPLPFVETGSYPGFPTDLQSPLMTVLAGIPGKSVLRENIFEARYGIVKELQKMGAEIRICQGAASIYGKKQLFGCRVQAGELRGGAALVLAGLQAEGETWIENCQYIKRGYEDICRDLFCLGAELEEK